MERSYPVVPEGGQAPSPWSFGEIIRNILEVKDAYHVEAGDGSLNVGDIELVGVNEIDQTV